ncbi:MAG: FKBP-type peptidyl-prolyl cis-trans isomerase [Treponema sp.]|nr:FKBP-type peptidyl-prolyl cis-trans isomerase [Treponema sp.]
MDNARYTMEQALEIFETAYAPMLRDREATFLEGNALRPGVAVTESGLQFEIIFEGEGPNPDAFSTVLVHYEGYLIDGTVFDSSLQRGDPEQFHLPSVIPGWAEGLQLMNVGAVFRFFIPYDIGYGPQGVPGMPEFGMPGIPPYATLIFDVELLEIVESAAFDW